MTLRSALEDIRETTLSAVSGLLGKLVYLVSLRQRGGSYRHWGMALVHGEESSQRALKTAHSEIVTEILRTPLKDLENDVKRSSAEESVSAVEYVDRLRSGADQLLPDVPKNSEAAMHLNSVLVALSSLQKNRERATRTI